MGEEKHTFRKTERIISGSERFFGLAEVCKLKSAEFKLEIKYVLAFGAEQEVLSGLVSLDQDPSYKFEAGKGGWLSCCDPYLDYLNVIFFFLFFCGP